MPVERQNMPSFAASYVIDPGCQRGFPPSSPLGCLGDGVVERHAEPDGIQATPATKDDVLLQELRGVPSSLLIATRDESDLCDTSKDVLVRLKEGLCSKRAAIYSAKERIIASQR
jgi:hypothetical protein